MNILKPIHPIHIPQAFSKAKTEVHSKDVCKPGMRKTQHDHFSRGLEKWQEIQVLLFLQPILIYS